MTFVANAPDDAAVIFDIRTGNINSFEILLDRYQDQVAQIVSKHVPRERAPEVVHDTFVQAYQSLGNFKGYRPFSHWLAKIAVRCCHDFWRGYYRSHQGLVSSCPDGCHDYVCDLLNDQSLEQEKDRFEARDLLRWALGQMSPSERMVLTLVYLDEYTVAEAAALLGWSVPRVKIQSFRARRKLRKILTTILPASEGQP